ncbi:MAG TPA: hypothetical protein VJA94_12240 [Candidatus Angelobacter sp.]
MYRLLACIALLVASPSSSSGQRLPDPAVTFSQSKQRLLADMERLPRYTCVQTITRRYYLPPFHWTSPSCKDVIAEHEKRTHELTLRGWDRLRLDVTVAGSGEIFSWVGAARFEEETFAAVAGNGPLVSGDFGPFIGAIFRDSAVKFQGEQFIEGHRLLEYSYDMPQNISKYEIDMNRKDHYITGYSGTFLLDRDDPDLFRLLVRTAELREQSGKCQAISEVEYERVPIHGSRVLVPRETRLLVLGRNGEETRNTTTYADCHEYSSKSVLRFDAVDVERSGGSAQRPESPIPAGSHFDWRIVTPIDSDTAAAGDPVEGVLRSPIRDKKGNIIAPVGTHIHGRLLVLAEHSGREYFEIGLKFESIDINGTTLPFYANLHGESIVPFEFRWAPQSRPSLAGAAWFIFNTKHLKLDHLDSIGVTTLPPPKEEKNNGAKAAR